MEWYHTFLCHPGKTRLELTLRQHYDWRGLRTMVHRVCKQCPVCRTQKKRTAKYSKVPPKEPELTPWYTLCIDLIGPYTIGKGKSEMILHCLTMIDPATGWFEIVEIPHKQADVVINILEFQWLTRYPWPTEVVMDRGREFAAEVSQTLTHEYGCAKKLITTQNPQANAMVERGHQMVHNMLRTSGLQDTTELSDDFGFKGILAAVRRAVNSTVHTTLQATPTQLVFARDALLNVSFQADWEYIKDRKQKRILQNNKRENATRREHTYSVGDQVMVKQDPSRKHGEPQFRGPYTVSQVNDNGTVKLTRATANGAMVQTWNIRNLDPCMA